jgi:hypothetical protein
MISDMVRIQHDTGITPAALTDLVNVLPWSAGPSCRRTDRTVTVLDVNVAEFWQFLERSAEETTDPARRLDWLAYRLSHVSLEHIADFQVHLENGPTRSGRTGKDSPTWHATVTCAQ